MFAAGAVFQASWSTAEPALAEGFAEAAGLLVAGFVIFRLLVSLLAGRAARRAPRAPRLAALPGLASLALAAAVPMLAFGAGKWATLAWVGSSLLAVEVGRQVTASAVRVAHRPLGQTAVLMGAGALYLGYAVGGFLASRLAAGVPGWLESAAVWLLERGGLAMPLLAIAVVGTLAVRVVRRRATGGYWYALEETLTVRFRDPRMRRAMEGPDPDDPEPGRGRADRPGEEGFDDDPHGAVLARARLERVARKDGRPGDPDSYETTLAIGDKLYFDRAQGSARRDPEGRRAPHRLTEREILATNWIGAFPGWLLHLLPDGGELRWWFPYYPILIDERHPGHPPGRRLIGIGRWRGPTGGVSYANEPGGREGDGPRAFTLRSSEVKGMSIREVRYHGKLAD